MDEDDLEGIEETLRLRKMGGAQASAPWPNGWTDLEVIERLVECVDVDYIDDGLRDDD